MIRITHHLTRATARLVRAVVAILVAAIVLLTIAQHAGGVGPWWLELSRYLPYPALLAPAAVALLLSCWIGRWWRLASAATLVLVATVTMGLQWHGPDRGAAPVRLMTYNIKAYLAMGYADGFAKLAREVALHDPDILALQDAQGLHGEPIARLLPPGPVFGYPQVYSAGQYVIASRYPLHGCAPGRLGYRGGDHRYLRCVVNAQGTELNLVSVHFESPRNGLNAARHEGFDGIDDWQKNYDERLEQARALTRDLSGSPRPLIVAGDLNAPESSPVVRSLLSIGLRDAFSSGGRGYGLSYGHALRVGFSFLRIDHILLSPEIGVADCFVGNGDASQHRPVIADLLLQRS